MSSSALEPDAWRELSPPPSVVVAESCGHGEVGGREVLMEEGPSSSHYESQIPNLDRLEPCGELLDSRGERLAQDKGWL